MRFYEGDKKCIGCQKTGKDNPRRKSSELCFTCKQHIELGKDVKLQPLGFSRFNTSWHNIEDLFISKESSSDHYRRIDSPQYIADSEGRPGSSKELLNSLRDLLETLDEGKKDKYEFRFTMHEADRQRTYSIRTKYAQQIAELIEVISNYSDRCYRKGFEEGQSLIANLATGKTSIDRYNQIAIGK